MNICKFVLLPILHFFHSCVTLGVFLNRSGCGRISNARHQDNGFHGTTPCRYHPRPTFRLRQQDERDVIEDGGQISSSDNSNQSSQNYSTRNYSEDRCNFCSMYCVWKSRFERKRQVHLEERKIVGVLHKDLPDCPGQVEVRFRQAF